MSLLWLIPLTLLFSLAYASASGAPWVPTFKRDIERAKKLLDLKPGEKFVELGCGDGRVVIGVTSSRLPSFRKEGLGGGPRLRAVGVELSIIQWIVAQIRRSLTRSWNVRFVLGNAFAYDLRDADAVYMFLLPETYEKIRPKLEAELKPGARVVTFVWPVQGWNPEKIDEMVGASKLYLYVR